MSTANHTILTCAHCGVSFEQTTPYATAYCSRACARAGRNRTLRERWGRRKKTEVSAAREIFIFSTPDGSYRREASPELGF